MEAKPTPTPTSPPPVGGLALDRAPPRDSAVPRIELLIALAAATTLLAGAALALRRRSPSSPPAK